MKLSKLILWLGLVVAGMCALAVLVARNRRVAQTFDNPPAPVKAGATSQPGAEVTVPSLPPAMRPVPDGAEAVPLEPSAVPLSQADAAKPIPTRPAAPPATAGSGVTRDPLARTALCLVGADPEAEAYWLEAINDDRLSAEERQNLIEDLNEDGLADPKHPSLEELPLIINRLALIEEFAPEAMDRVNLDAFAEAYKDLVNLAALAMGGGEPVR